MGFFIKPSPTYPRPLYGTPHLTRAVATSSIVAWTIYPRPQTPATLCTCIRSCPARCSPTLTSIAAAYPPTKIQKEGLKSPPKLSHKLSIYHTPIYYTCHPLHRPPCPCQRGERTRPQRYTLLYSIGKRGERKAYSISIV